VTRLDPGVRQTLSSVLRPPAGFRLDAAVGTSFTLDLRTLLAVPLTFALLDGVDIGTGDASSGEEETPAAPVLLGALLAYAQRLRVLSDARYINAPARPSRLYSLLEPAIAPVDVPTGAHFHPKFWLLRFVDENSKTSHRLVLSTRNLTDDRSWDLVVVLDEDAAGIPGAAKPAIDLLRAVAPGDVIIESLTSSAASAPFLPPPGCDDLRLHAWPVGRGADPTTGRSGSKMLVVSPFIGLDRLRTLATRGDHLTVVSRPETFDRLAAGGALPRADLRRLVDLAADDDGLSGELHAKLVVLDEAEGRSRWWVGSLNATENGIRRNAEALVELTTATASGGVDALLGTEGNSLGALLEPHVPRPSVDDDQELAGERKLRQAIGGASWGVTVTEQPDGQLAAALTVEWPEPWPDPEADIRVRFNSGRPADRLRLDLCAARSETRWPLILLEDVTSLLEVQARLPASALVTMLVVADLVVPDIEARQAALFRAIVPDVDVMLRLILLLLMSGHDAESASAAARRLIDGDSEPADDLPSLPLVEEMLRSYARDPDRLRQAGEMIAGLPRDHPRTGPLRALWDTFAEALGGPG
jgi:hypothetical protein